MKVLVTRLLLAIVNFLGSERWVLHSTREYAERVIAETGLKNKPSDATLARVAEDLFRELEESTGLHIPPPFFKKAHRWYVDKIIISVNEIRVCLFNCVGNSID